MIDLIEKFHKVKFVKIPNGENISYRETGKDNSLYTLVFLHGFIGLGLNWEILVPSLGKHFKIFAFYFRGSGYSSYNKPIESLHELADDLKLVFDELSLTNITLIGTSTGGAVTQSFVLRYPQYIHNFILLSSIGSQGLPVPKVNQEYIPTGEINKTKLELLQDPGTIILDAAIKEKNKEFWKSYRRHHRLRS